MSSRDPKLGTQLDPELIIGPLFGLLFGPEYWPNSGSFSNREAGLCYSPKFEGHSTLDRLQINCIGIWFFKCWNLPRWIFSNYYYISNTLQIKGLTTLIFWYQMSIPRQTIPLSCDSGIRFLFERLFEVWSFIESHYHHICNIKDNTINYWLNMSALFCSCSYTLLTYGIGQSYIKLVLEE